MRIWSIHPKYLDPQGLVALWRESLLAQKVLEGKTKGYKNHPQLDRFKCETEPLEFIGSYLEYIWIEASKRGYNFDKRKIKKHLKKNSRKKIFVTKAQINYEIKHLKKKLKIRNPTYYKKLNLISSIKSHPLFKVIPGPIEKWESAY